jgi:hypothetical protein
MLGKFITKKVSYACSISHALLLIRNSKIQMAMDQRCIHSSWIGSLTPFSTNIETVCTLQGLIYALQDSQVPFASSIFFLSSFTTNFSFNGIPLEVQPS